MSKTTYVEQSSAPATPSTGQVVTYAKTDGRMYGKDDTGTEFGLTGAGGSVGSNDNRIVRSDGTGGSTIQGSTVTVDDSGNFSGINTVGLVDATELTIATGAITRTATYHRIDTEADAGTDDLDTISGGTAGQWLVIRAENTARTVVVRHNGGGSGNIRTFDTASISLDETYKALALIYDGTNWLVVGALSSGGANTALSNLASVAINTSLISDTDNTDDLGSSAIKWANAYTNALVLEERSAPSTPSSGDFAVYAKVTGGGQLFMINDGGVEKQVSHSYAILRDEQTSGTQGGASSAATWNNRNLNTEVSDVEGIVSIASNQFTPIAGDYLIFARGSVHGAVGLHRLRLYNVTGTASVDESMNNRIVTANEGGEGTLVTRFTANGTDAYRIDHYTQSAVATNGLGPAMSLSVNEVYCEILLVKLT